MNDQTTHHAECPDCHALVADLDAHKRWHGRVIADIATAVDKAEQRMAAQAR